MASAVAWLDHELERAADKGQGADVIRKQYVDIIKVLPSRDSSLSLSPADIIKTEVSMRLGSAELLSNTAIRDELITDVIRMTIGRRQILVENGETNDAKALPVLMALLDREGFTYTFESNGDGTVACRLGYPLTALKKRLASGERP